MVYGSDHNKSSVRVYDVYKLSLALSTFTFSLVQLLSHVWLFVTPWAAACQASLSTTNSLSLLKLMSMDLVMPSNHLILGHPLLLLPLSFSQTGCLLMSSSSHQVAKVLELQLQLNEYSGLISFRIDRFHFTLLLFGSFSSVQSLSRVSLFATPWIAAHQASLSITNSWSLLKLMSIESVMPSSHFILLSSPSPLAPNPSQHQGLFQWVNSSHEVAKVLEFQL